MESGLSEPGERETESFSDTAKAGSAISSNSKKDPLRNILNITMADSMKAVDCDVDNTARDFSICLTISDKTPDADVKNNNACQSVSNVLVSAKENCSSDPKTGDTLEAGESSNQPTEDRCYGDHPGMSLVDPCSGHYPGGSPIQYDSDGNSPRRIGFSPNRRTGSGNLLLSWDLNQPYSARCCGDYPGESPVQYDSDGNSRGRIGFSPDSRTGSGDLLPGGSSNQPKEDRSCGHYPGGSPVQYDSDGNSRGRIGFSPDSRTGSGNLMPGESSNQPTVDRGREHYPEGSPVRYDSDSNSLGGIEFSPDSPAGSLCTHASTSRLDFSDGKESELKCGSTPEYYSDIQPGSSKKMRYMLTFEEANLPGPSSAGLLDNDSQIDCTIVAVPDTTMPSSGADKSRQRNTRVSSQSFNADEEMPAENFATSKLEEEKRGIKRNYGGSPINPSQEKNVESSTTDEPLDSTCDADKATSEKISIELPYCTGNPSDGICLLEIKCCADEQEDERKGMKRKLDVADIIEESDTKEQCVPERRDFSFEIDSICQIHKGSSHGNVEVSSDVLPSCTGVPPSCSDENSKQKATEESLCTSQKVVRNLKTAFAFLDRRFTDKMQGALPPSPESSEKEDDNSSNESFANFVIVSTPKLSLKTIRRSFRQRRAAKKLDINCPVCGLSLLNGKLLHHFHEETEKLSKLSLYVKAKKKLNLKMKRGVEVNEKFKSVRARREERTLAKLLKLKPWVDAVCPACHALLPGGPSDILNHAIIWSCPSDNSTDSNESSEDSENQQLSAEEALQLSIVNCASVTRITNEDEDLSLDIEAGVEDEFGAQQYFGRDVHHQGASSANKSSQSANSDDEACEKNAPQNVSGDEENDNNKDLRANLEDEAGEDAEANMSDDEENNNDDYDPRDLLVANLKAKIRSLEAAHVSNLPRCAVCMGLFKTPVVSVVCWHILCENCWLTVLKNTSLCPLCKVIISPRQLRKVYL